MSHRGIALIAVFLISAGAVGRAAAVAPIAASGRVVPRTFVVFPFENRSSRADLDWISESFAELLTWRLESPARYGIAREERLAAYAQLGLPADTPLTLASEYKVAAALGADWAVVGDFTVEGDKLSVRARLLEPRRLKLRSPLETEGVLSDLVELESRLAWRLLAAFDPEFTVGTEDDFARLFPDVRLDAFESYIRGVMAADPATRVHFLEEADRRNPQDHRAAFELGRTYFNEKDYEKGTPWLQKVAANDKDYLEAQFLLGIGEFFLGHAAASEIAFDNLARRAPLDEVINDLGVLKARRGDYAHALQHFERASEDEPTDADYWFNRAVCLYNLNRYDEARVAVEQSLGIAGDDAETHTLLAATLGALGDSAGKDLEIRWLEEHAGSAPATDSIPPDFQPLTRLKKAYSHRAFRQVGLESGNTAANPARARPAEDHADGRRLP